MIRTRTRTRSRTRRTRPRLRATLASALVALAATALGLAGGDVAPAAVTPLAVTPAALAPAAVARAVVSPAPFLAVPTPVLSLLGQSTWVGDDNVFSLRIGVAQDIPATDHIVVTAYPRLTTRTDFDAAADGRLGADPGAAWIGQEPVGTAPAAFGGGVWARVPVDTPLAPGDLQTAAPFEPGDQSGVYPLQIQLLGANYTAVGSAISTFLVYSSGQAVFPKLLTSVTVPVAAGVSLSSSLSPAPLPATSSTTLSTLSTILQHAGVALNLAVAPLTAESLMAGPARDRATLKILAGLVGGGDQLLPALYVPVSAASLATSGLASQIGPQLQAGSAALHATLGAEPDTGSWVINGPVDDATLQLLRGDGLVRLITPDKALTSLPAHLVTTTYARPTRLSDGIDAGLEVFGADATIASRDAPNTAPVLAAEQTLAELAMIELETPSLTRGVALSLPSSASLSPTYLQTLLGGLQSNPFVQPVTATQLLTRVPTEPPTSSSSSVSTSASGSSAASVSASSTTSTSTSSGSSAAFGSLVSSAGKHGATTAPTVPIRSLRAAKIAEVPSAGSLRVLVADIQGLTGFLPEDTGLTDRLRRQLLIAPASGLTAARRATLLDVMAAAIRKAESTVRLPGATSITLTSLKATLPLIVLSDAQVSPHIRLVLASPKLEFRAFRPPNGSCQVEAPSTEVCTMVLRGPETVLRVPVESRTSGVFSLDVLVTSPDASLTLASARDTVRSTAVSSVGIVIIVVSLLCLGIWWIRNIHSGRRARQLVRRPGDDIDDDGDEDGSPDGGIGPAPPSHPVGPSLPVGPSVPTEPRLTHPPSVVGGEPVPIGGRRHRQPHAPAHRESSDPKPTRDAPAGR
jgi:hypothetical protein